MSLPKGKTKKTKDYNMKAFYKFEETTNMENLQMKVSSYGAVLKYGEQVLVTDIGWKGFAAAVYEFIETPEETGLADIECRTINKIIPDEGGFVSMLILDMDSYAEKYGDKAVRKNLTIPAWLNTFAENNHINFSQVLQDALVVIYQNQA